MLEQAFGKCDVCGTSKLPFTIQEAEVTCLKCGEKYKNCEKCKVQGCQKCGGKLESAMDWASKNGIMF
jgi:protein-arginine kinase activator protein McsA